MENVVQSPCNNQCFVPPGSDLCMGCFRTIKEIIEWLNLSNLERDEIIKKIELRKKEHGKT